MTQPLLALENVSIHFGNKRVVDNLNLELRAGERLALVGESGSGKTVTALSILRLLPQTRISGRILFNGENLVAKSDDALRQVRGADIAMVFQEPMSALNPLYTIGAQIAESLMLHEGLTRAQARYVPSACWNVLAYVSLSDVDSFPHQLSGGQLQRAVIAMALACNPRVLIADEPTTALDVTVRARIVKLLIDLQEQGLTRHNGEPMAILLITHDLNLVRRFAQRVAVIEKGKLVESGETETLFAAPQHPYTIKLINSIPVRNLQNVSPQAPLLLETRRLRVEYPKKRQGIAAWWGSDRFVALASANIELRQGETIGIVGESGSGKSTLSQAILQLIRSAAGEIEFEGAPLASLSKSRIRQLRSRLQVVFQDPFGSLSPRQTVSQIIGEGLALHFPELSAEQRYQRIAQVLQEVGLPLTALDAYPHEFSGGQRQRIAIARAVVLEPKVLILDEPTSALDVSIQNQVLKLLLGLQQKYGLSYVLITHDLSVVNALAHRVYVLKDGEIVEHGETEALMASPANPYTQALVQASL